MPPIYTRLGTVDEEAPLACAPLNPNGIDSYVVQEGSEALDEMINCRVCNSLINLEGRRNQRVLKCGSCLEATPILPAPPGKKYVRCHCHCLILCVATSIKLKCPRTSCHRIITLASDCADLPITDLRRPNKGWVACCAHCHESFICGLVTKCMIQCPYCKRSSSIGGYSHERARFWLRLTAISLAFNYLLLVAVIIWLPFEFLSIWLILFLPTLVCLGKTLKFVYRTKSSPMLGFVERQWIDAPPTI